MRARKRVTPRWLKYHFGGCFEAPQAIAEYQRHRRRIGTDPTVLQVVQALWRRWKSSHPTADPNYADWAWKVLGAALPSRLNDEWGRMCEQAPHEPHAKTMKALRHADLKYARLLMELP